MAQKLGRKKTEPDTASIRAESDIIEQVKYISLVRKVPATKIISDLLRDPISKMYDQAHKEAGRSRAAK